MNGQQQIQSQSKQKQTTIVGLISPTDGGAECAGCSQPLISVGRSPGFKDADQEYPLFCPVCDQWFHKRCTRKSLWSGHLCTGCDKPLLWPAFYCQKCDSLTTVKADSAWPNFHCVTCSQATSMAALESVGAAEMSILVLIGAIATAGFVMTFVYHLSTPMKVIGGAFALPLGLPWLANGLAAMLAGMMPASTNARAPAAGGMKLQVVPAREFRRKPVEYRLRKVYLFYAIHAIPAMIFCILALALIHWFTSMAHSR
jgi:hypothetical protein